jgi:hypothetical protein
MTEYTHCTKSAHKMSISTPTPRKEKQQLRPSTRRTHHMMKLTVMFTLGLVTLLTQSLVDNQNGVYSSSEGFIDFPASASIPLERVPMPRTVVAISLQAEKANNTESKIQKEAEKSRARRAKEWVGRRIREFAFVFGESFITYILPRKERANLRLGDRVADRVQRCISGICWPIVHRKLDPVIAKKILNSAPIPGVFRPAQPGPMLQRAGGFMIDGIAGAMLSWVSEKKRKKMIAEKLFKIKNPEQAVRNVFRIINIAVPLLAIAMQFWPVDRISGGLGSGGFVGGIINLFRLNYVAQDLCLYGKSKEMYKKLVEINAQNESYLGWMRNKFGSLREMRNKWGSPADWPAVGMQNLGKLVGYTNRGSDLNHPVLPPQPWTETQLWALREYSQIMLVVDAAVMAGNVGNLILNVFEDSFIEWREDENSKEEIRQMKNSQNGDSASGASDANKRVVPILRRREWGIPALSAMSMLPAFLGGSKVDNQGAKRPSKKLANKAANHQFAIPSIPLFQGIRIPELNILSRCAIGFAVHLALFELYNFTSLSWPIGVVLFLDLFGGSRIGAPLSFGGMRYVFECVGAVLMAVNIGFPWVMRIGLWFLGMIMGFPTTLVE